MGFSFSKKETIPDITPNELISTKKEEEKTTNIKTVEIK